MVDTPCISACLIVRDEAQNLPDCLRSLAPLADEIIVADTGSEDQSREIARAEGARVIEISWEDDFARARNAVLAEATGEWILVLDADERLHPADESALRARLAATQAEAFTLEIRSRLMGDAISTSHIVRLFRNRPAFRYRGRLHEQIAPAIAAWLGREAIQPERSGLIADHDGYLPEQRRARGKVQRNETLLRRMVEEEPESGDACFLLARELHQEVGGDLLRTPRSREATALYDRAFELIGDRPLAHVADLGVRRLRAHILWNRRDGVAKELEALRKRFGPSFLLAFVRGELALAEGHPEAAAESFKACLGLAGAPGSPLGELDERYTHCWLLERLGRARLAGGQLTTAREYALEAKARGENEAGPRLLLAAIALAQEQTAQALTLLVEGAKCAAYDPRPQLELARILVATERFPAAEKCLDAALRLAPGWEDALALRSTVQGRT